MECNQQQTKVAATKTLYENFLEEKCESDLLIPDYFPAAEKIIQCNAVPVITSKGIEGDRLNIEGNCRFCIIYQGEENGDIKSLSETVSFSESFPLKDSGNQPWTQVMIRAAGTSCRLLNPRKINAKATVSIALKVKDQVMSDTIEKIDCNEAEALFMPATVYTVLEHVADTVRIQGEIEVHTDIQDILKAEGAICIKDIKMMPGKAIVKGVADLFLLFTPESDPSMVESTSTAIPFSQVLELRQQEERGMMEATSGIINIRSDVEADDSGKNRLISLTATVLTEGEIYENQDHLLLREVYSNRYPLECREEQITAEELTERGEVVEHIRHDIPWDEAETQIIQVTGTPIIQKITGQDKTLSMEGVLDASLFIKEGDHYRSIDKVLPFTVKKELKQLSGHMRCEVHPCVIGMECNRGSGNLELKTEMLCSLMVFSKNTFDVISEVAVDIDHPLEQKEGAPLVVYFAEKGERLWDIARKYATSVSAIKSVNEMDQDILKEKKLLLISRS
ncbi:MAG: DUF3794 domain-containing protein [Clostridia bacterium]|nr:DUF3794 domain-containing protein [Clostridia bacterium]